MDNIRRQFIKGGTALVAATSLYLLHDAGAQEELPQTKKRYALLHDETKCIGCNACAEACRLTNQVPQEVARLRIERTGPYGEFPDQYYRFTRVSCQHCEEAPCVNVCPTGAANIDRSTGIVSVNSWKCVGCQYCIAACPYHIRFINPVTHAADKCDFCKETNLREGKQPACVMACPTGALMFGDLEDPHSKIVAALNSQPVYRAKEDLGTHPKLFRIRAKAGEVSL
ncbi:4Fe-4S dicluster domain-containing protein [Shewanella avicenniae]|uniref:4Fe-4S dicluster domain-containing protein n=1 Tax=Shewanella avicenniae TaxID=2814294 RepID=A0ABX7QS27_9GAMM|nr:4Fe-4S dicluster domain-containing protein [Shewanella avicenniae]QSX33847.1 4Fe-4S dicluster domain-containing protein [Shewanella avicenniae]